MTRITFQPSIRGMGHRIRCNLIARRIREVRPEAEIMFLLRKDDIVPPLSWCDFPWVKNKIDRTRAILRANAFVLDGFWFTDFRTRLQSLQGTRILISQASGFPTNLRATMRHLEAADAILVPWPRTIFEWPDELRNFLPKVHNIEPILGVSAPSTRVDNQRTTSIYAGVTTERRTRIRLEEATRLLRKEFPELSLILRDSVLPALDHSAKMQQAQVIASEGTTMLFEAMALEVPRIHLPSPEREEQLTTARQLFSLGAAAVGWPEDPPEKLASCLRPLLRDKGARASQISIGRRLVSGSGVDEAARIILAAAEG